MAKMADRIGMQRRIDIFGVSKKADDVDGIALKDIRVGDIQPVVVNPKICLGADLAPLYPTELADQPRQARRALQLAHLQRRA